ncbi:hypothetical protein L2Y96_10555 [Luteibacter aegosomaticola]|uniref:hypothetical protein n=1 Tax=Luteibacter aegosomaticola TaxID=2911538 RepID=UPI001FFB9EAD|nr:hypothetical protein [Luteibacter aegosomaticola]UPG92180.1 hypothetical protein L2Y96_10555 [Luteibacter aegosomaticola]
MDWVPVLFITFKVIVFGIGMFLAIKWHYDQGKLGRQVERRAVMRMAGLWAAIFLPLLAGLLWVTFYVCNKLGMT